MPPAPAIIGLVSVSDRASRGEYQDLGIPALREWLARALITPWRGIEVLIADETAQIQAALLRLIDEEKCSLVLTTGGTGPAARDVTPEATLAIAPRELPGFGEQMRQVSLRYVPTAILSRQTAAVRGSCLVVNLPGQPKAVAETLSGVFPAIPYCVDLIGGAFLDSDPAVARAFRPKKPPPAKP